MTETKDSQDSDKSSFTVELNNKEYELNKQARRLIQERAKYEYSENEMFSCFWKVASPNQYDDNQWHGTIHEAGDPILVIETEGPIVPWERLDKLNVEMQEVGPESQIDREMDKSDEKDNGNGVKTIDPGDVDGVDDAERTIGRTHFRMTPEHYEDVPDPDGEEADKIPPKPVEMGDEPEMIKWIPDYPDLEHTWSAGEAICPMYNRVEWNVQVKADQPRLKREKDDSHDHWESILKSQDCEIVAELTPSQETPPASSKSSKSEDEVADKFKNGKAGGGHWRV